MVTGSKTKPLPYSQGFSLLELLVVLVIIGVMLSVASLSFRAVSVDPAETALDRLRFNVQALQSEAVVRSQLMGIEFSSDGYRFVERDEEGKWQPMKTDSLLASYQLDESLAADLIVEGQAVALPAEDEPQVIIYPTGEMTPFSYALRADNSTNPAQLVAFDALGQVLGHTDTNENP